MRHCRVFLLAVRGLAVAAAMVSLSDMYSNSEAATLQTLCEDNFIAERVLRNILFANLQVKENFPQGCQSWLQSTQLQKITD